MGRNTKLTMVDFLYIFWSQRALRAIVTYGIEGYIFGLGAQLGGKSFSDYFLIFLAWLLGFVQFLPLVKRPEKSQLRGNCSFVRQLKTGGERDRIICDYQT